MVADVTNGVTVSIQAAVDALQQAGFPAQVTSWPADRWTRDQFCDAVTIAVAGTDAQVIVTVVGLRQDP